MKASRVLSLITSTMLAAFVLLFTAATAHATYAGKNGRITFVSNLSGTYQLYTINPDGSDMRQITNLPPTENSIWTPDYSPDGRQIVFSHDMTGALELYTINADGSGLTQVTHDGNGHLFARWSPGGQRFVLMSGSPEKATTVITTMRTDGSDEISLTDDIPFESYQPEYTPDGKQIVFASQAGGLVSAVWIMNADGSNKRRLTDAPIEAGGPAMAQTIGAAAATQTITLANTGNVVLNIGSVGVTGSAAVTLSGSTCGATLAVGANCAATVSFAPTTEGAVTAALAVASNAPALQVGITGTGTTQATAKPALSETGPIAFADTQVGSSAADHTTTLGNSGNAALKIATPQNFCPRRKR